MAKFSRLRPIFTYAVGATCGSLVTYYYGYNRNELGDGNQQRHNSISENKHPKWDANWDRRQPASLLKSPYPDNDNNNQNDESLEEAGISQAVRYIVLIRHGQYNLDGETDEEQQLTEIGRKQASLTGERLSALKLPWTLITQSTMTRAMETCSLIRKHLPEDIPVASTDLLREGAPIPPDPPHPHWKPDDYEFYQEGAQIEAAFRKFFHRAPPEQTQDSYEIIVCHSNVIRYFVMRALQLQPEAWLRLSLDHASITSLAISPSGHVILIDYSNSGYMPHDVISV